MAKVNGVATQLSGKVGQLIYRQTKYGTVVYEAKKASVPQRTEAQMQVRTQWGNMAAVYRQFNQTLKKGFEGLNGRMNDYNAFIQANTNVVKVYVPKSVRLNGGSVLAPYQITRGSMPSIAMTKNAGGVLVSDLNVGSLVIGEDTTVADLANAVIALNDGYEAGDQVTFFYGQQTTDAVTGIPRARIYGYKVMLNPGDSTPLLEVVSSVGFSSVDGKLGMDRAIVDGAAVWIHSREDGSGGLKVSTQFMYVDSSVLAGYQTSQAMAGAANSYGGINTSAVYLQPGGANNAGVIGSLPQSPSGGGSGTNTDPTDGTDPTGGTNTNPTNGTNNDPGQNETNTNPSNGTNNDPGQNETNTNPTNGSNNDPGQGGGTNTDPTDGTDTDPGQGGGTNTNPSNGTDPTNGTNPTGGGGTDNGGDDYDPNGN